MAIIQAGTVLALCEKVEAPAPHCTRVWLRAQARLSVWLSVCLSVAACARAWLLFADGGSLAPTVGNSQTAEGSNPHGPGPNMGVFLPAWPTPRLHGLELLTLPGFPSPHAPLAVPPPTVPPGGHTVVSLPSA